jgi:hypothetical protein
MNEVYITKLKIIAAKKAYADNPDFDVYDYCGGNVDDAYQLGINDGEIFSARDSLIELNIES